MLRELIASLLLFLIGCVLLLSGREISLRNQKTYLATTASLKGNEDLDFKLSLDSNRLRLRRKNGILPFSSGSSYSPDCLDFHTGNFCRNALFNEQAYRNSLFFSQGILISDLQSIFTDNPTVSDWWDWNGVLGLNPFGNCKNDTDSLDPLAPLNQLRGDNPTFALDTEKLTFTNEPFQGFQLPLNDGMFFEMEQISFGHYNFRGTAMKGKIDLESRYIKVPRRYFNEIWREFQFLYKEDFLLNSYMTSNYRTQNRLLDIQIAIAQPSKGKKLNLPLKKYWKSEEYKERNFLSPIYSVQIAFIPHFKSYWSFGLQFLEDFRVHVDVKGKMIGFEPIH